MIISGLQGAKFRRYPTVNNTVENSWKLLFLDRPENARIA